MSACNALGIGSDEWTSCHDDLIEALLEAEDWLARQEAIVRTVVNAPPVDSDEDPEFVPSHPTLSLVQSAMEEQIESAPAAGFHRSDPKWLSVLYERLRARRTSLTAACLAGSGATNTISSSMPITAG